MQEKGKRALSFSIVARPVFPSLLQLPEVVDIALLHSLLLSQLCYILHFADTVERCHSEFGEPLKLVADYPLSQPVSGSCRSSDLQTPLYTSWKMSDPSLVLRKCRAFEKDRA
jgi:hypothetical protein